MRQRDLIERGKERRKYLRRSLLIALNERRVFRSKFFLASPCFDVFQSDRSFPSFCLEFCTSRQRLKAQGEWRM